MREKQPVVDGSGQNGAPEPAVARSLLFWLEALGDCQSQEELAHKAKLDSRTLRRFAAGKGGRKTTARLASGIGIPLWVVREAMLPAIGAVIGVWRDREGGSQDYSAARCQALETAARISVIGLLASRFRGEHDLPRGAHLLPADIRVLIRWLESLGGWSKEELARRAGLTRQTLWLYANGDIAMGKLGLRNLTERAGLPFWLVEGVMLPAILAVRVMKEHARSEKHLTGWEGALTTVVPWLDRAQDARLAIQEILAASQLGREIRPSADDRKLAEGQWQWLKDRSSVERILLVKGCRELQSWGLAERLCAESREAASNSAKEALELAFLALRVAKLARGEEHFCLQLQGYAYVHVANAWRVGGRLRWAEGAFSRGFELWNAGSATKTALLPGWRVLDLEGSLCRDQRRFSEALERLDRALENAPRDAWGRIVIKKASTLDQMGNPTAAISALDEAAPLVDGEKEPRHLFMMYAIRGTNLCHLGRFHEAQELLPKAQDLGAKLGNALDLLRLDWLRGRILSGAGQPEEALAALVTVQETFRKQGIAYDYALVSLEVGSILLEQGKKEEVMRLALEMKWIFTQQGIHAEAVKALDLFRRAAEGQRATPELARNMVRYLYQAQYNSELSFAA